MSKEARHANDTEAAVETPTEGRADQALRVPMMRPLSDPTSIENLSLEYNEEIRDRIMTEARATELPEDLAFLVEYYDDVIGDRTEFLTRWLFYLFEELELSCVPAEHAETACEIKTIMTMYDTLLDDLSEKHDDLETFWEIAKAVLPRSEPDWDRDDLNQEYLDVGEKVWKTIDRKLKQAPRYEEFEEQFHFDMRQAVNAMDYSRVALRNPGLSNLTEAWHHSPHNMMMYGFVDVDVMFSPEFDRRDLRPLREVVDELQHMWRIGNWVITWERELEEHDYTAGIVIAARQRGLIDEEIIDELEAGETTAAEIADRIDETQIEESFVADWDRRRQRARLRADEFDSIDLDAYVDGMEFLMQNHLATRGHR